jgi:hypothetical protein
MHVHRWPLALLLAAFLAGCSASWVPSWLRDQPGAVPTDPDPQDFSENQHRALRYPGDAGRD